MARSSSSVAAGSFNHATQACVAALALARAQEAVGPDAGPVARLVTRIGVHTGPMLVGNLGSAQRFDYTAIGAVINLAARLCSEAADGEVLVSGRLAAAAEVVAEVEELGERQLKGMARPVAVACLRTLKAGPSS